jgi:hypothetical protein
MTPQLQTSPLIAGSVLPIKRAEELLQTLPGVDEIHVLTTAEVAPKQTVRNIESALIAHLGMRVDHRKISVATSLDARKPGVGEATVAPVPAGAVASKGVAAEDAGRAGQTAPGAAAARGFYFEDVEVRRSRVKGLSCRVTLTKGDQSYVGEAEGMENERSRVELAARAALRAIVEGEPSARTLDLGGARVVEAFDREFAFVGVNVQLARESALLTGTCEVKDSPETASVLAVLDATNRWLALPRRA